MRRCLPVLLALFLVSGVAACARAAPSKGQSTPSGADSANSQASRGLASEAPTQAGFENGFTHCCGDFNYVMQVDCSEQLLRCYSKESGGWKQTYGRNCKNALEQACYQRGCLDVCE